MKHFIMLIGIPCSGKSTFTEKYTKTGNFAVISSDNIIEEMAKEKNTTYSNIFKDAIGVANKTMLEQARKAFDNNENVIWDQTNLNIKSRRAKLVMVPSHYYKTAIIFNAPDEAELKRRLNNRPGKNIPLHIINSMTDSFETPTESEGFNSIFCNLL